MLSTPVTSHVDYNRVYEPAEDSFLLLDTLSAASEVAFLKERFASPAAPLIVELGTGSGVVLAFITAHAHHILGRRDVLTLGVDINAFACQAATETVKRAVNESSAEGSSGIFTDIINGDLASFLKPGESDILIFNPPYVPAPLPDLERHQAYNDTSKPTTFDQESHLLELSYAGGLDGMEITNKLLLQLPDSLSPRGLAYILLCAQNKPKEVIQKIKAWGDTWAAEIVGTSGKTAGFEKLVILRVWRTEPMLQK